MSHAVSVTGIPGWVDAERLLGVGSWSRDSDSTWTASLPRDDAAFLMARLRNIGLGGTPIEVHVRPRLKRPAVRAGRTQDARARRDTTPGFTRPGVRLDEEGRYSLTPEALALRMGKAAQGRHVTDLGCGAGGNSIGFARAGCDVLAIEHHDGRRQDMLHNAAVYGVRDRITPLDHLPDDATGDLLFIDPPWGTDYDRLRTAAQDLPLLLEAAQRVRAGHFREMWAKLPPSFDPATVEGADATAVFGLRPGDAHRVKFVWLRFAGTEAAS